MYEALRREGKSKASAARITNAKSKRKKRAYARITANRRKGGGMSSSNNAPAGSGVTGGTGV